MALPLLLGGALAVSCGNDGIEPTPKPNPPGPGPKPEPKAVYSERAVEQFNNIKTFYGINAGDKAGLYVENYPTTSADASYLWPYDGLMSGLACLNELGYDVQYEQHIDRFDAYFRTIGGLQGWGSSTNGRTGGGDRFYDDNSIVGLDLLEAYRQTGKAEYLTKCGIIYNFLKSGRDDVFGGAMWWCESQKNKPGRDDSNKPTCANGYGTWFLLDYYNHCPEGDKAGVLAFAKELYNWLYTNLRDPEDNVYWNSKQADGTINKTKWTYNSGAMIAAGVRLYVITGEVAYLNQAKATAQGAYSYFARPRSPLSISYPDHDPWFTVKLIRSYIELLPHYSQAKAYIDTFIYNLDYAYEHARYGNGLWYENWLGGNDPKRGEQLLMQAAALEGLGLIALYKGEKKE